MTPRASEMRPSLDEVCVVGAGARTPAGHTLGASAAAVRAGLVCFEAHPAFRDSEGAPIVVGRASRRADWELSGAERYAAFAIAAAREALRPIARRSLRGPLAGALYLALPEPRTGRPEGLDAHVVSALTRATSRWLELRNVAVLPRGHAAGLEAIDQASRALREGTMDFALVGGTDSYLDEETLTSLEDNNRLRRVGHPFGFTPAEGAGFCLLTTRRMSTRCALTPEIAIVAAASSTELNHRGTGAVTTGAGLSQALRNVMASMPREGARIERAQADLNGEPDRVDEMGFALSRTASSFASPGDITAPAVTWGDVGAASGPLLVGLALARTPRHARPGSHEIAWCSSDGGVRAAVLMRRDGAGAASRR